MADRFYGIDRGEQEFDIVEQATTPAKDVEVSFDLAVNLTKSEILLALDMFKNHILKGDFPPA